MEKHKLELLDQKGLEWLMLNPNLNWLRWILVLPTALVGFIIGLLLQGVINWFYEPPLWMLNYLIAPIYTFISSLLFIVMGTEMAPANRKTTGLILLIISILITGIWTFILVTTKNYIDLIYVVSAIIGIYAGYSIVESNEKV